MKASPAPPSVAASWQQLWASEKFPRLKLLMNRATTWGQPALATWRDPVVVKRGLWQVYAADETLFANALFQPRCSKKYSKQAPQSSRAQIPLALQYSYWCIVLLLYMNGKREIFIGFSLLSWSCPKYKPLHLSCKSGSVNDINNPLQDIYPL